MPVYTKCPFCKTPRKNENQKTCSVCGLNFSEMPELSNKDAKIRTLKRKFFESLEDEIVYTNVPPKDIDVPTAKTLVVLFGIFGGVNFYVGKFLKALIMLALSISGIALEFAYYLNKNIIMSSLGLIILAVAAILWFIDVYMVFSYKFTYPVRLKTFIDVDKFYEVNNKKVGKK